MSDSVPESASVKARLAEELKRYLAICLYLFICFAVVMVYEAAQPPGAMPALDALGMALVKALVIGKFMLIGEALKPGTRINAPTLLHRVAWRTLGLLAILAVFKFIEELVLGLVHGVSTAETLHELGQQSPISLVAAMLLMLLILVPMILALELDRALGTLGLKDVLLSQQEP